jgi:hypothetical protein
VIFKRGGGRPGPAAVGGRPGFAETRPVGVQAMMRPPARVATETTIRPAPPRLARDKVLMLLTDGCYHSAHEISNLPGMPPGAWYVALQELIEHGYKFGRRGNSLVLLVERARDVKAPAQELAVLLAGVDATKADLPAARPRSMEPGDDDREVVPAYEKDRPVRERRPPVDEADLLRIGDIDVQLSAKEYVTSTRAILARKSSGKTYLAMVVAEELLRAERATGAPMPFVAFDPTGVWYGLSAGADGMPSSHEILRMGGRHGDYPLDFEAGSAVADMVVGLWPRSVILDVSDMLPEEQHQFFGDFGNKLYTINAKPIHLFVDEADDFMPQQVESGNKAQRRALGVGDRIVRRARVKGIGVTLITQRPAVISKNVLSQVDGIFFLNLTAPHDLEAVNAWMQPAISSSERSLALEALPSLERGEAFFIQAHKKSGAIMKFRTREKLTFDSSRTPTVDDPEPPVPSLGKVPYDVWEKAGRLLGRRQVVGDVGVRMQPSEEPSGVEAGGKPISFLDWPQEGSSRVNDAGSSRSDDDAGQED